MNRRLPWLLPPAAAALLISVPAAALTYMTVDQAKKEAFPSADDWVESHIIFTPEQKKLLEEKLGQKVQSKGLQVWTVYKEKTLLGYFVLDYVIGKHEYIDYAVALSPDGKVAQVDLLTYRESYGSEISQKAWRNQFVGKSAGSPMKFNYDIVNIGGATLSCRHVTEGIQKILASYDAFLRH